jgi:hypothetical protein
VRSQPDTTLIVTDGFSCREMIAQETDRRAVHFAQVLQMALDRRPEAVERARPEKPYTDVERTPAVPAALLAVGALAAGSLLLWKRRKGLKRNVLS